MNLILAHLLTWLLTTNDPSPSIHIAALVEAHAVAKELRVANTNDPIYKELRLIMIQDDRANDEVNTWAKEAEAFAKQGAGTSQASLQLRAEQRFKEIEQLYKNYLEKHPKYAPGHLAYGSFLYDIHEEIPAVKAWEKARELDPLNPASWNNLANHYGHRGPVTNSFLYYAKAIELNPTEVVYIHNLATCVYLFRKEAQAFYKITESEVFEKSLKLYRQAMEITPHDFVLASDYAQSFYGIRPMRVIDALKAWNQALTLAKTALEREGIYLHLARIELNSGQFLEARSHLNLSTNAELNELKQRLIRNLDRKEHPGSNPSNSQPNEKSDPE